MNTNLPTENDPGSSLLADVAKATALREGTEGIAQVLQRIYSAGAISLKELSRKMRIPLPVLAAVRRELERANIVIRHARGIGLTEEGIRFVETQLGIRTKHDFTCTECHGRQTIMPPDFVPALKKLEQYFNQRPPVDVMLDQTPALPESSIRRAL